MPQIKKKRTSGQAKNFITRTQAVRKLQISLPDFRRLCIFKGIYPREPRNKKKASKSATPSTTFYYTKDIQYLLHEPLLRKFREHKALAKKISKALGRGEVSDAARLEKNLAPRLPLDHIIKERYPTFVDALRDLDDALSMLFLFANLPSTTTIPPKTIARCQRLCLEFQHYLIVSHSLKKSFLSIKGIYYQATIQGQDVLWLVPYQFVQRVTDDIDFRIMGTFVEFYTTLLGFVNFRLYTAIGLVYPPKFNTSSDEKGGELRALTLQGKSIGSETKNGSHINSSTEEASNGVNSLANAGAKSLQQLNQNLETVVRQIAAEEEKSVEEQPQEENNLNNEAIDVFEAPISSDADVLPQPSLSTAETAALFAPFTFFLSRETPRQPLEFLLRAFGCNRIGWDAVLGDGAFTNNEADASITHQVVDRPPLPMETVTAAAHEGGSEASIVSSARPNTRYPGRTYIQPQWVWDCVNAGKLLRPDLYAPGAELPPHLSPWVKPSKGQYDPTIPLVEQEQEGEAEESDDDSTDEEKEPTSADRTHTKDDDFSRRLEFDQLPALDTNGENGGMDIANDLSSSSSNGDDQAPTDHDDEWAGFDDDHGEKHNNNRPSPPTEDNEDEEEEEDDDDDDDEAIHQRELEAEISGIPLSHPPHEEGAPKSQKAATTLLLKRKATQQAQQEELERQKMMMSRKKRKTLEKILYSNRQRDDHAAALRRKRRKIEKEKAAAAAARG